MKCIWQIGLLLTALTLSHSFADPEDSNMAYDKPSDLWSLQWTGQDGNTYFIQKSHDMINWSYLPHVDKGSGSNINWNFQTNSDRFFLRLKHTDMYTEDPEAEDFDNDQIPTLWELENGLDPLLYADGYWDADVDGLRNNAEFQAGTSPTNADTDGDSMPDGYEVDHGLNATANDATTDLDGDSVSNINEYQQGTKPDNPDSDGDGQGDGQDPQPNDPSNGTARAPNYVIVPIPNSNGFSPLQITDTSYVMLRDSNDSSQIGRFKLGDASVEWVDASGVDSRKFLTEDGTLWATKSKTSPGELVTTITPDEPEGFTPDHHEASSQASRIVNAPVGSSFGAITVDGDLSIEMNVKFTRKDERRFFEGTSPNGAYRVTTVYDTERTYYISHLSGWVDVYANLDFHKHDFRHQLNGVSVFNAKYEEKGIVDSPYELVTNTITGDRLYHYSGKGLVSNKGHIWLLEGEWTQDRDGVTGGGTPFLEHPDGSAVFPTDANFQPTFLNDDGASIGLSGLMLPSGQVIGKPGHAMDSHPDGDWTFIGSDNIAKRIPEVDANGHIVKDAGSGKTIWTEDFKFIPINPQPANPDGSIPESVLTQSQLDAHGYEKVSFGQIAQNGLIAGLGYKPDQTTEVIYAIPVEVEWLTVDGKTANEDPSDNLEYFTVPATYGNLYRDLSYLEGLRYFPGAESPNDNEYRSKVKLRLKTVPDVDFKIKIFDVDDPTSFDDDIYSIDPNDSGNIKGNDNKGTGAQLLYDGKFVENFSREITVTTNAQGIAEKEIWISVQPGNNYRSVAEPVLATNLSHIDQMQVINQNGDHYVSPNNNILPTLPASKILTIWRKLYVEFDSMGPPPNSGSEMNFDEGTINAATTDSNATLDVGKTLFDEENRYKSGYIDVDDLGRYTVLSNTDNGIFDDDVIISGNPGQESVGNGYQLFDDDVLTIQSGAIPPRTLPYDLSGAILEDRFADAYILPVMADEQYKDTNIEFERNVDGLIESIDLIGADAGKDLPAENKFFWTAHLLASWQGDLDGDADPYADPGRHQGAAGDIFDSGMIYIETLREVETSLQTPRLNEKHTVVHEIGHQGGGEHDDSGIMHKDNPTQPGQPDNRFSPKSIKKFRIGETY